MHYTFNFQCPQEILYRAQTRPARPMGTSMRLLNDYDLILHRIIQKRQKKKKNC